MPGLRFTHFFPSAALAPYVDRFWSGEGTPGAPPALSSILPGTGAEIFFHIGEPFSHASHGTRLPQSHLLCVRSRPLPLRAGGTTRFLAVRFRAGMLHHFVDVPGAQWMDSTCDVAELWGSAGAELAERIAGAHAMPERVRLLERFLLHRLSLAEPDSLAARAVSSLYANSEDVRIERLAADMGVGRRQLERRFLALTGQTPAQVRRISRFQKTVKALMLDHRLSCVEAALAHGYYDQAHFQHDFKALAGTSPQAYLDVSRRMTHFYNTPRSA